MFQHRCLRLCPRGKNLLKFNNKVNIIKSIDRFFVALLLFMKLYLPTRAGLSATSKCSKLTIIVFTGNYTQISYVAFVSLLMILNKFSVTDVVWNFKDGRQIFFLMLNEFTQINELLLPPKS